MWCHLEHWDWNCPSVHQFFNADSVQSKHSYTLTSIFSVAKMWHNFTSDVFSTLAQLDTGNKLFYCWRSNLCLSLFNFNKTNPNSECSDCNINWGTLRVASTQGANSVPPLLPQSVIFPLSLSLSLFSPKWTHSLCTPEFKVCDLGPPQVAPGQ